MAFMPGHYVGLIAFDLARQLDFGLRGHDPGSQLGRHPLDVILIQTQFLADLMVGEIQAHEVQTQNPDLQRLVMPGQDGSRQIVEIAVTDRAAVFLPGGLARIATLFRYGCGGAVGAMHTFRPTQFADLGVTLGIVQQVLKMDHSFTRVTVNAHSLAVFSPTGELTGIHKEPRIKRFHPWKKSTKH
jgi:hypothetical protein